jgi:hypothetical protein
LYLEIIAEEKYQPRPISLSNIGEKSVKVAFHAVASARAKKIRALSSFTRDENIVELTMLESYQHSGQCLGTHI